MGTIFYGLAGEGRGHASRVRTIVDGLKNRHTVKVYAPNDAYDFLSPLYEESSVEVKKIPGLQWQYDERKRLNYPKSAFYALQYLLGFQEYIDTVVNEIEREKPDLIITDFDPLLPRAARKASVPFISIDHQHFLTTYDLSSLPAHLKIKADFMSQSIPLFYSGQEKTVVSSFYFPPLRQDVRGVTQAGVLLRDEVLNARPESHGHLVVYLRKFYSQEILGALLAAGREAHVYGLGNLPSQGNLHFFEVSSGGFVEDLANASALVTTAGNQVIGEALYLGKPVIAVPETGNFEQEINGHFLEQSGAGISVPMDQFMPETVFDFFNNRDRFVQSIDRKRINGNDEVMSIVENILESGCSDIAQSLIA